MEWISTRAVLTDLERLLTCGLCENYLIDPCSLENCDHNFCRKCIEKKLESDSECPDCGVFSWIKDLRSNHQLSTTVTLTLKLRQLIDSSPKVNLQLTESESLPENTIIFNSLNQVTTETNLSSSKEIYYSEKQIETKEVMPEKLVIKRKARKEKLRFQDEHVKKYSLRRNLKRNSSSLSCKNVTNEQTEKNRKYPSSSSNGEQNERRQAAGNRNQLEREESHEPAEDMITFTRLQAKLRSSTKNNKSQGQSTILSEISNKSVGNQKESTILEEKGNARLNIKRRRKRTGSNIKQYLIRMESLDTLSQSSEHCTPQKSKKTVNAIISPSQNARNKRGETPLHLAAIKGDILSAQQLIKEECADPNAKDNAGWTPLHEACNHGYLEIVELFLDHGALFNIPGFDNDTPLHDAVANGRLKVVKLLVERGASLTARNKQGLIPKDYAVNAAMKNALSLPGFSLGHSKDLQDDVTTVKKCEDSSSKTKVVLGTALNNRERETLKKCVFLLGGSVVSEFNESVTHIVTSIDESGHSPRTMKYFSGILTGKWIVSFKWISDCLRKRKWISEDHYEVQGTAENPLKGPKQTRYNMTQQLPRLFDGCAFFLRGSFNPPTPKKEDLLNLIKLGGGKILQREPKLKDDDLTSLSSNAIVTLLTNQPEVAYHTKPNSSLSCCTQFIIFDPTSSTVPKIICSPVHCTAPVTWLMDCISSFELLDIPDKDTSAILIRPAEMALGTRLGQT